MKRRIIYRDELLKVFSSLSFFRTQRLNRSMLRLNGSRASKHLSFKFPASISQASDPEEKSKTGFFQIVFVVLIFTLHKILHHSTNTMCYCSLVYTLLQWRSMGRLQADYQQQKQIHCPTWLLLWWVVVSTSQPLRLQGGGRGFGTSVFPTDMSVSKKDWFWRSHKSWQGNVFKLIYPVERFQESAVLVKTPASCKCKAKPRKYLCFSRESSLCVTGAIATS